MTETRDLRGPTEAQAYLVLDDTTRERIATAREAVRADFAGVESAHDISHLDRVARLAAVIAHGERADPAIAGITAYVHDYHRLVEQRRRAGITTSDTTDLIDEALERARVDPAQRPTIVSAVDATGRFSFSDRYATPAHLVAACLHDADMLDAMGAIGIARAFLYGGTLGEPMWDETSSLQSSYRSGRTSSVVAHFYEKLLHLRDELHTPTARQLATERHEFLELFLQRFHLEWGDAENRPAPRRPRTR
ncbi:HD domain-containing protein [Pseudonocardia spinosispora]|uniref:HD domain-containing protein n=1 Tax=Pseudonocardia spinosispora TaxID=103441 RepID=UPI00040A8065|nr:hypothetical protein [Pseudonocardia spinosispora]